MRNSTPPSLSLWHAILGFSPIGYQGESGQREKIKWQKYKHIWTEYLNILKIIYEDL